MGEVEETGAIFGVQIHPFGPPDEEGVETGLVRFDPSIWREHCTYAFGRNITTADFLSIAQLLRILADHIEEEHTPVRRMAPD